MDDSFSVWQAVAIVVWVAFCLWLTEPMSEFYGAYYP